MEAVAILNRLRVSPRKLNLLASAIRGLSVERALRFLSFSQKRVSGDARKTLLSAIANAENNFGLDIERLYVKEAYVGKSLVMKRSHARAKGRGVRIEKPFSRLSIIVSEKEVN